MSSTLTTAVLDQGDCPLDEATLRRLHVAPYLPALESAKALTVMVSYSSWQGARLHGQRYLLTDLLTDLFTDIITDVFTDVLTDVFTDGNPECVPRKKRRKHLTLPRLAAALDQANQLPVLTTNL